MWRLTFALPFFAVLSLPVSGCKGRKQAGASAPNVARVELPASTFAVADPQYASQLLSGFYQPESQAKRSWRWTKKNFAVRLATPAGSAQKGAQLQLRFAIVDPVIQNLKSITLAGAINGLNLGSQRYEKSGQFSYIRDVPPSQLQANAVPVEFTLDRALPPSPEDRRELGIVVTEVGLTANP